MEMISGIYLDKEEWTKIDSLKHWINRDSSFHNTRACGCKGKGNYVTLLDHDYCIRGRIDTTVCTICDSVIRIDIVR